MAAALFLAPQAQAQPNLFEQIQGNGSDAVNGTVEFFVEDLRDVNSLFRIGRLDTNFNQVFECVNLSLDPSDLLKVNGTADQASSDLSAFLDAASCTGTPPTSVVIDCSGDGDVIGHFVGSATQIFLGQRIQSQGTARQASADCIVTIDGQSMDAPFSFINRSIDRLKQQP
jgi:hypothetical protein